MVRKEGPGIDLQGFILGKEGQARKEIVPIPVTEKNLPPFNPPTDDMMQNPRSIQAS